MDIRDRIANYASAMADEAVHLAPGIPAKALGAALRGYARDAGTETPLLLIDTTSGWFGAANGLLLTDKAIHARAGDGAAFRIPFEALADVLLVAPDALYLNDKPAIALRRGWPEALPRALERLLKELAIACNPVKSVDESLGVRICLACSGDPKPLLVLARRFAKNGKAYPPGREPHAFLVRCAACARVQLDVRGEEYYGAYAFDAGDSARLAQTAGACPRPLATDCACAVHAALGRLPALPLARDRHPDPCLRDLPRLALQAQEPPRIELRSGRVATRHANAAPKAEGELVEGLPHGRWTLWHESGERKAEGAYVRGGRTGVWMEWNERGALRVKETYADSERAGTEWNPHVVLEEALQVQACLACGSRAIEAAMLLEQRGVPPQLEGHVIAYDHLLLVRCLDCGAGQLDKRAKDSFDWESVYEQGTAWGIEAAGMALIAEAAKACPQPLSAGCGCAAHMSLKANTKGLPPDADGEFRHVPRFGVERTPKGIRLRARSDAFATSYAGGAPHAEGTLREGALEGRCALWHRSGGKAAEGEMRGGRRDGRWIEWNANGEVAFDRNWREGYTVP